MKIGKIIFEFVGDPQLLEVHVFACETFLGTPTETEGNQNFLQKYTETWGRTVIVQQYSHFHFNLILKMASHHFGVRS